VDPGSTLSMPGTPSAGDTVEAIGVHPAMPPLGSSGGGPNAD
jgi:hypothetical protein